MKTAEFEYHLPAELIAQTPIEPRDASRLLIAHRSSGRLEHRSFRDILGYVRAGDVLVCNDSRVIPARLFGRKHPSGGKVEVLLIARRDERVWEALTRGKRILPGIQIVFQEKGRLDVASPSGRIIDVTAGGSRLIEFDTPIESWLEELGHIPLPPYIHESLEDPDRYQTVYARIQGSVAAPTAGLHFTPELIQQVKALGAEFAFVTLHIGLDTFRPVQEEEIESHHIHSEFCVVDRTTCVRLNTARQEGRRIIAVGTTAVRSLESAALATERAGLDGLVHPFAGATDLFIYPGYHFRAVDAMITNFHLPRSTLLMLVSAFAERELILHAYEEAVRLHYRFYSFGDAMFLV